MLIKKKFTLIFYYTFDHILSVFITIKNGAKRSGCNNQISYSLYFEEVQSYHETPGLNFLSI